MEDMVPCCGWISSSGDVVNPRMGFAYSLILPNRQVEGEFRQFLLTVVWCYGKFKSDGAVPYARLQEFT